MNGLVDQLFLSLARTKECVTNGEDETFHVKKYYRRARDILKFVAIRRPPPIFIINISDLPKRIIDEFEAVTDDKTRAYVLTQAVGRIFENLDFEHYHLSIARNLEFQLYRYQQLQLDDHRLNGYSEPVSITEKIYLTKKQHEILKYDECRPVFTR